MHFWLLTDRDVIRTCKQSWTLASSGLGRKQQGAAARDAIRLQILSVVLAHEETETISITIDVHDIPVLREPINRAAQKAFEQDLKEGRREWRLFGIAELFFTQLVRSFGDLPDGLKDRIVDLPAERLMEVALTISKFGSLDDLRAELEPTTDVDVRPSGRRP